MAVLFYIDMHFGWVYNSFMEQTLYRVVFKDGSFQNDLTFEQCKEFSEYLYLEPMEALTLREKMSKLKRGERLK